MLNKYYNKKKLKIANDPNFLSRDCILKKITHPFRNFYLNIPTSSNIESSYLFVWIIISYHSSLLSRHWQITVYIVKFQTREPLAIINEHAKVMRGITVTRLRIKKFQQGGKCIAFAKYVPHSYISMSPGASSTFISLK